MSALPLPPPLPSQTHGLSPSVPVLWCVWSDRLECPHCVVWAARVCVRDRSLTWSHRAANCRAVNWKEPSIVCRDKTWHHSSVTPRGKPPQWYRLLETQHQWRDSVQPQLFFYQEDKYESQKKCSRQTFQVTALRFLNNMKNICQSTLMKMQ